MKNKQNGARYAETESIQSPSRRLCPSLNGSGHIHSPAMRPLKNLEVVLVRAENPINIGQAARAMKNFGVSKLHLVQCSEHLVEEALTPGWKARFLLKKAVCHTGLDSALSGSIFNVGFTARAGKHRGKSESFPRAIPKILKFSAAQKVRLVFGNEKNGLSNEELKKCSLSVFIPTGKEYSSLNLAHAAAVSLGMLYSAAGSFQSLSSSPPSSFYPKPGEFDAFLRDWKLALELMGYQKKGGNALLERVYADFENFFRRKELDRKDLHLFHSFISRTNRRLKP